jgi:putative sterol carrier protein
VAVHGVVTEPAASDGVPAEYLAEPARYFLEWMPRLLRDVDGAKAHFGRMNAVAQFELSGEGGGAWYFALGGGTVEVAAGVHPKPSFTLAMTVDTWRQLNRGEVSGLRAYLRGDVKLTGSRWKLMRVSSLFSGS